MKKIIFWILVFFLYFFSVQASQIPWLGVFNPYTGTDQFAWWIFDNTSDSLVDSNGFLIFNESSSELNSSYLRIDGGNNPTAEIDWGNYNLINVDNITVNYFKGNETTVKYVGNPYPTFNDNYDDVMVITNTNDADSIDISEYFIDLRDITHQCNITASTSESINWAEYLTNIYPTISGCLNNTGNNNINYIVTTKGVPLKIIESGHCHQSVDHAISIINSGVETGYYDQTPPLGLDAFCYVLYVFSNDNYYNQNKTFNRSAYQFLFAVSRLTGETAQKTINSIPKNNVVSISGDFILDNDPTKTGSSWDSVHKSFYLTCQYLTDKGYNVTCDNTTKFFVNEGNLSGYISHGSNDANNPTDNSSAWNMSFVNGSFGATYVSGDGRTFDPGGTYGQSLMLDFLNNNLTTATSHVAEPYNVYIMNSDKFYYMYLNGSYLADAYYNGLSIIPWRNILIGDPKLRVTDSPDLYGPNNKIHAWYWDNQLSGNQEEIMYCTDDRKCVINDTIEVTDAYILDDLFVRDKLNITGISLLGDDVNITGDLDIDDGILTIYNSTDIIIIRHNGTNVYIETNQGNFSFNATIQGYFLGESEYHYNKTISDTRYWNEDGDDGLSGNYEGNYSMNTSGNYGLNYTIVDDCYYISNGSKRNITNINDLRHCNDPNGVYSIQRFENINASLQDWNEIGSFGAASLNVSDILLNLKGPQIKYYTSEFNPFIQQKQIFLFNMLTGGPKFAQFQIGQSTGGINLAAEKYFFNGIRAMYIDLFSYDEVYFDESYESYANFSNITLQPYTNYTFQYNITYDLAHQSPFINVTQGSVDNISYHLEYRTTDTNELLSQTNTLNEFYNNQNVELIELSGGLASLTTPPDILEKDFQVKVILILNDTLNISGLNFTHNDGGQNYSFFWKYGTFDVDIENVTTEEWVKRGNYLITGNITIQNNTVITENTTIGGNLTVEKNFTGNQIYGEFYIPHDNITITINSPNVPENITNQTEGYNNGFIFSKPYLQAQVEGKYLINYGLSFSNGPNNVYHTDVHINGLEQEKCETRRKIGASGDVGNTGTSCIIQINVGDLITLAVTNEDTANDVEIESLGFTLWRVGD